MIAECDAFVTLQRDLPRVGQGEPADVSWAAQIAGLQADVRICDAGCGPRGDDIAALLDVVPEGHVTTFGKVGHFVAEARAAHGRNPRVSIGQEDMTTIKGPHDLIWCARAVYFFAETEALTLWRPALSPAGVIAFSKPCWFSDTPSETARQAFADYPAMTVVAGSRTRIAQMDYTCPAARRLSDAAWEACYTALNARIAALRRGAGPARAAVPDEAQAEAACWRREKDSVAYLLCLVRSA